MLVAQIFYPCVFASVVYGPVTFESDGSGQSSFQQSFDINNTSDLFRLYLRNNLGVNASDNLSLLLNGQQVLSGQDLLTNLTGIDVSLSNSNLLDLIVNNSVFSSYTAWIEDGTPGIKILTPTTDTVSDDAILLSGLVQDLNNTHVSIENGSTTGYVVPGPIEVSVDLNGVTSIVQAENGYFSTTVNLSAVNNIIVSFTDATGTLRTASVLLDGDYLNQSEELALGFDPLDPDSDCSLTVADESGNGVPDGLETFGGDVNCTLPVFVKSRLGADPFSDDSDWDGLSDFYEVMKLIPFTSPVSDDTDNDGVLDSMEDVDNDTLSNLQEFQYSTDPLNKDNDRDGLADNIEIQFGSNPLVADSDSDGLRDDSEYRLGANPMSQDSDTDGVLDGLEVYTSVKTDDDTGVTVTATGTGDIAYNVSLFNESSTFFLSHPALISRVVNVSIPDCDEAMVSFDFNQDNVSSYGHSVGPSVMMVGRFDESVGMYLPLDTTVEVFDESPERYTVSVSWAGSGLYACFNASNYSDVFRSIVEANYGTCNVTNSINVSLDGNVSITVVQGQQSQISMSMSSMQTDDGFGTDYVAGGGSTFNLNVFPLPGQLSQSQLPGYQYVKSHTINGSMDGALSDYQVMFVVHAGNGSDGGKDVYLNGHSLSWPDDIRFADSNNNLLSYWIESSTSSAVTVWVKVPSIPASPDTTSLYVYYGMQGDSGASCGDSTFLLFDNFDGGSLNSAKWSIPSSAGTLSVNGGLCTLTYSGSAGEEKIMSSSAWSTPVRLRSMLKSSHLGTTGNGVGAYEIMMLSSANSMYEVNCLYYADAWVNFNRYRCNYNGDPHFSYANIQGWNANTFAVQEIDWVPGVSARFNVNDANPQQITSNVPASSNPLYAKFAANSWTGTTTQITVDWIFAAKYTQHEPTHSTWTTETPTLNLPNPPPSEFQQDTDNDGLPDHVEQEGFLDEHGARHFTNASSQDTDEDGLLDNEEVQYVAISGYNSGSYKLFSYPDVEDSDGDTLWDDEEYYLGTKPLMVDSDGDGLNDDIDPNPLTFDAPEVGPDGLQVIGIILKGAIYGDMGDEGGFLHFLVGEDSDSPFYVVGAILGGFIPLSDIRDLLQSLGNLDILGSILNAIGFVPGVGDAAKISGTVGLFIVKHSDDAKYINDLTRALSKYILKNSPDFVAQPVMRALTNDGVDKLMNIGLSWDTVIDLGANGKNIKELVLHSDRLLSEGADSTVVKELIENGVDISKVRLGSKRTHQLFPSGLLMHMPNFQWYHTISRHVDGTLSPDSYTGFFPMGSYIGTATRRTALQLPNSMTETDLKYVIQQTLDMGSVIQHPKHTNLYEFSYKFNGQFGINEVKVWVDKTSGEVRSAFPVSGSNVRIWNNELSTWIDG